MVFAYLLTARGLVGRGRSAPDGRRRRRRRRREARVAGRGRSAEELDFNSQHAQRGALWSLGVEVQGLEAWQVEEAERRKVGDLFVVAVRLFAPFLFFLALLTPSPVFIILRLYSSFNAVFGEMVLPMPTYLAYKP